MYAVIDVRAQSGPAVFCPDPWGIGLYFCDDYELSYPEGKADKTTGGGNDTYRRGDRRQLAYQRRLMIMIPFNVPPYTGKESDYVKKG